MVQQTVQGASANYAKEMERLSAKESLLLAVSHSDHHLLLLLRFLSFPIRFDAACVSSDAEVQFGNS